MYAVNRLVRNYWKIRLNLDAKAFAGFFGLGIFLGVVAVSMWQQWTLTFGLDPQFLLAFSLVLSLTFAFGRRWQRSQEAFPAGRSLASLILCLAAWTFLHPSWIDFLTILIGQVLLSTLESATTKPVVAGALAVLGWCIPGLLGSAIIAQGITLSRRMASPRPWTTSVLLGGIACGMLANSLVLAPWLGVNFPALLALILASGCGLWLLRFPLDVDRDPFATKSAAPTGSGVTSAIRIGMACLIGGLLACNLRLADQLLPPGAFVVSVQFAGVILGIVTGLWLASRWQDRSDLASWAGLLTAATSTLLLALQPQLVELSLNLNSLLTSVAFLLAARALLLMAIALPFGLALAWIATSTDDENQSDLVTWGTPFGVGFSLSVFVLGGTVGLIPLMAACGGTLVAAASLYRVRFSRSAFSIRTAFAMVSLIAVALPLPLLHSRDDAARTAKLLFSTPTFLAYRYGWDLEHLPMLDDVRMIERIEGKSGPLTLWRGRVAELYVRESGIPRAVVTKDPEIVPQFAPEVLQAVYSLVLSDRPNRVLLLGLSAGVPLSTCLGFPVREAVCIEGDSHLIDLVQGPLARETGFNPLTDERVTLRRVAPELALMAQPTEPFDVILSSPPASSTADGAVAFTQEFYERASLQLTERGLFCQRFECVDYGLAPFQSVVKAMRKAFRRVIAVETAGGEFLLMAANADNLFVPSDLATRLEMPHVCQILARSGIDWSALLNLPTYDHEALGEICDETRKNGNTTINGHLAASAPLEVMRWANKQMELQTALTSTRISPAPFWTEARNPSEASGKEYHLSRRSRFAEWLGDAQVSKELLRRLNEVVTQRTLVHENPDTHWWAYRKTLRKQLQDRPRVAVQQVKAIAEKPSMHPEDARRRDYFIAFGQAARCEHPTRQQIAEVEQYLQPYDPLVTYFARQEIADLLARAGEDSSQELMYRLHVIYFTPTVDASVRNVAKAVETLVTHPEAIPDNSARYDALNGLIQTLRVRWEVRQANPEKSTLKSLDDADQSVLAIEHAVASLDGIANSAGVSDREWQTRKEVIDRLMLRPLRTFRTAVQSRHSRGLSEARAIVEEANVPNEEVEQQ